VAGLFLVYALALIPGLLIGGPASDRFGRRPVVLPFVALSPVATLLLVLGPRSLAIIAAGRALAGLCSGVVFGSASLRRTAEGDITQGSQFRVTMR
jgi:MFS family permease